MIYNGVIYHLKSAGSNHRSVPSAQFMPIRVCKKPKHVCNHSCFIPHNRILFLSYLSLYLWSACKVLNNHEGRSTYVLLYVVVATIVVISMIPFAFGSKKK